MFEHKQKQRFEFIHIWPKWKLHVSIYFNANNRVGLAAAVSISASLPSLLQCWNGKSAHYSWLCMIFDTILKKEWREFSIKNGYIKSLNCKHSSQLINKTNNLFVHFSNLIVLHTLFSSEWRYLECWSAARGSFPFF